MSFMNNPTVIISTLIAGAMALPNGIGMLRTNLQVGDVSAKLGTQTEVQKVLLDKAKENFCMVKRVFIKDQVSGEDIPLYLGAASIRTAQNPESASTAILTNSFIIDNRNNIGFLDETGTVIAMTVISPTDRAKLEKKCLGAG